ncbi:MAG: RHS repeat-associated core domain-containing protein [Cyanothece sp. SIO1E1]|nr:RHS repeat-associated core domain-containing protein [Cyanothece sp. SIO1E1]
MLQFHNILAGGTPIGTWDGNQRRYFLKDHLGSVRTTVDQSGNVDGYDDYYPFGLVMPGRSSNSANPTDNYKFTGHERDDEAGLTIDYMMARNYDPMIGRFMQIDPLSASFPDYSPYNYTLNNPINMWDPDGRAPVGCCKSGSKKARETSFALRRPMVALTIGQVSETGMNISSVSSRASINIGRSAGLRSGEGSPTNALRHGIWQASISSRFGATIAAEAGYSHEENPNAIADNMSMMSSGFNRMSGENGADEFVDLMNNSIAMQIGLDNPNASLQEIAGSVLETFHNSGFYTVSRGEDGKFYVQKTQLTEEQYQQAMDGLSKLNSSGLTDAGLNGLIERQLNQKNE